MRIQFQILLFAVFFNIALFFIAATGFFPPGTVVYGDSFTYDIDDPEYDINDPSRLPPPNEILERLYTNSITVKIGTIPLVNIDLTYVTLMASIVTIGVIIGVATKSLVPISLMLVGVMFTMIWANSHDVIYKLTTGMDSSINYLILMFLIGVMLLFVILIFDTSSGQKSTK